MTIDEAINQTPDAESALAAYNGQAPLYRRVPIGEVNTYLIERFLIGRLRLARDNPAMPDLVRAFLGDLLTGIQIAQSFDGTSEPIRTATAQVTSVLVSVGVMSQDEADGFLAMLVTPVAPLAIDDVRRRIRQRDADDAIAGRVAALNDYQGLLAAWVESGGEMPS